MPALSIMLANSGKSQDVYRAYCHVLVKGAVLRFKSRWSKESKVQAAAAQFEISIKAIYMTLFVLCRRRPPKNKVKSKKLVQRTKTLISKNDFILS